MNSTTEFRVQGIYFLYPKTKWIIKTAHCISGFLDEITENSNLLFQRISVFSSPVNKEAKHMNDLLGLPRDGVTFPRHPWAIIGIVTSVWTICCKFVSIMRWLSVSMVTNVRIRYRIQKLSALSLVRFRCSLNFQFRVIVLCVPEFSGQCYK